MVSGFIVGIDGGGTKSEIRIAAQNGDTLFQFKGGAINLNGTPADVVKTNLSRILNEACQKIGPLSNCLSMCIGAAGISNPAALSALTEMVRGSGYIGPLKIVGDFYTALYGALQSSVGIILISGTGSVCYGRNSRNEEHRTGGLGHLLDDGGSGYAIGRDILTAVARAEDGRGKKTVLTDLLLASYGMKPSDIVPFVYSNEIEKGKVAALAPMLTDACERNDVTALAIAEKAASELALLVTPLAIRLGLKEGECAMSGSILQKDPFIRERFLALISVGLPSLYCRLSKGDAALGAIFLAKGRLKY